MKFSAFKFYRPLSRRLPQLLLGLGSLVILTGCETFSSLTQEKPSGPEWAIYYGVGGQDASWYTLKTRAQLADVILIGEQHDNLMAHELEQKLVEAVLEKHPDTAVAMEMFERDEQSVVDSYANGEIDATTLFEATESKSWGGSEENWRAWYLPVIDTTNEKSVSGARVIAANAPRKFATIARLEGYEALENLAKEMDMQVFILPDSAVDDSLYEQRFHSLMGGHTSGHGDGDAIDPAAYFRAQQLWDATMADAVLAATKEHARVMLLVGDFHIAHDGGLVLRVRHNQPKLEVLTVSISRKLDTATFDPEDIDRADFVVYTREGAKEFSTERQPIDLQPIYTTPWQRKTGPRSK